MEIQVLYLGHHSEEQPHVGLLHIPVNGQSDAVFCFHKKKLTFKNWHKALSFLLFVWNKPVLSFHLVIGLWSPRGSYPCRRPPWRPDLASGVLFFIETIHVLPFYLMFREISVTLLFLNLTIFFPNDNASPSWFFCFLFFAGSFFVFFFLVSTRLNSSLSLRRS